MLSQVIQGDLGLLEEIGMPVGALDTSVTWGAYYAVICTDEGRESDRFECAYSSSGDASVPPLTAPGPVSSDIPVLLLNGRFDPVTPPRNAEAVARTLSHSRLVTFPTAGHGVLSSSKCANQVIAQFLEDPEADLDLSCLDALPELDFVVPEEVIPVSISVFLERCDRLPEWYRVYAAPYGVIVLLSAIVARRLRYAPRVARLLGRWDRLRQRGWLWRNRRVVGVAAALLAPPLLLFGWIVPLGRRVGKKWKRWERREHRSIPRLARCVPGMAALLGALTFGGFLVFVSLHFDLYWRSYIYFLGFPRSASWLVALLWCYVVLAGLLTAGTMLGIRSPK